MRTASPRRAGAVGVDSVDRFVFTVPDLEEARRCYAAFGLDVRQDGRRLDLFPDGNPHCRASIFANAHEQPVAAP